MLTSRLFTFSLTAITSRAILAAAFPRGGINLLKRAIPEPGEEIRPYELSLKKFSDRQDYHNARENEDKAYRAFDKLHALEFDLHEEMNKYALKHKRKIEHAKYMLYKQRKRLNKRLAKRRSYKKLAKELRRSPYSLELDPAYVRSRLRGRQGIGCVYRQQPLKDWQLRTVEAAEITGRKLNHFDAVGAQETINKYGRQEYTEANEAKRKKGEDQFTAVVYKDPQAAQEIVNYHEERIPKLERELLQYQTEVDYYTPKFYAWANQAARVTGHPPITLDTQRQTTRYVDGEIMSSDSEEGSTVSTQSEDNDDGQGEYSGSNYNYNQEEAQQGDFDHENSHREEGYHIYDSNYNRSEEGAWSAAIDYNNYWGENETDPYHRNY